MVFGGKSRGLFWGSELRYGAGSLEVNVFGVGRGAIDGGPAEEA